VNTFELTFQSLRHSFGRIFNSEENLYDEFDFLSNHRNIGWNDFLSMPVKTKRYLIGKINKELSDIQEQKNHN
jgi:hypothetical protein